MHLVSCTTPPGSLEAAPRTALLAEPLAGESDRWDGFWSPQTDAYYARCTHRDGEVEWFALVDDDALRGEDREPNGRTGDREATESVVSQHGAAGELTQREPARPGTRVAVVVARSPDGRRMLVGSGRRTGGRRA